MWDCRSRVSVLAPQNLLYILHVLNYITIANRYIWEMFHRNVDLYSGAIVDKISPKTLALADYWWIWE